MNITEMRAHVVGPCDEAEKAELRELLPLSGEVVDEFSDPFDVILFHPKNKRWEDYFAEDNGRFYPTISFPAFKAKYLTK